MSRSTHKFARLDAIVSKGELGSVLIRLMMAINDMSLAMDAQRRWTEDSMKNREHRERGAKIYFIRLQISHIYEAMKINADAVIGMRYDATEFGERITEVLACGTAVRLDKPILAD